jgi:hypothetical protein
LGYYVKEASHKYNGGDFNAIMYQLMMCGGCGQGGLAVLLRGTHGNFFVLEDFYPGSIAMCVIPKGVPTEIEAELREAERCASIGAYRAGTALLRSALEKALKLNGYTSQANLKQRIDAAHADEIITAARKERAQQNIRVLGNDILHDAWREVKSDEYEAAHDYTQRILEDFYDHRAEVEKILKAQSRIP